MKFLGDPLNLVAVLFALTWGAVALLARPIGDYGVETDFYGDFARYSRQFVTGQPSIMNGFRGPGYYVLLGILAIPLRDSFLAAKLISVLSAALGLRLTGGLFRKLWNPTVGLVGSLCIAANLIYIEYAYRACSDPLFFLLFVGCLALLLEDRPERTVSWAAAGLLAAAAWLTRYNGVVLLPAAAGVAALTFSPRRRTLKPALAFAAAFAAGIAPWALFLWHQTGNPFWNRAFENIAVEVFAENPSAAQRDGFMTAVRFDSVWEIWKVNPAAFLTAVARNLPGHLRLDAAKLAGWPWAAAAVAGLIVGLKAWNTRPRLAFALVGVLTFASLLPIFYNERFMMVLLPWWAAVTAVGLDVVVRRLAGAPAGTARRDAEGAAASARGAARRRGPAVRPKPGWRPIRWGWNSVLTGIVALAAVVSTAWGVRLAGDRNRYGGLPTEILALARDVRARGIPVGPNTPIAARKPHLGYYLNAPVIPVPLGRIEELRAAGAHYQLVSRVEVGQFRGLRQLLMPRGPQDIPPGLSLAAQGASPCGNGLAHYATLYAVEDPRPCTPPPPPSFAPRPSPPPGLSRIDFLRLSLVRWHVRTGSITPAEPLLRRMSPSARERPDVLQAKGDVAMIANRLTEAGDSYRRALAALTGGPPAGGSGTAGAPGAATDARRLRLRLAGASLLQNDRAGYRQWLIEAFEGSSEQNPPGSAALEETAQSLMAASDAPAALAPIAALIEADPSSGWAHKAIGFALEALHRPEAFAALSEYLRVHPDDSDVQAEVNALRARSGK